MAALDNPIFPTKPVDEPPEYEMEDYECNLILRATDHAKVVLQDVWPPKITAG